jgi:DNA repair exonuclease SbcCD ATPase subunit
MATDPENIPHTLHQIRIFQNDVDRFESNIKTLREQVQEIIEGTDEHERVLALTEQLKQAKVDLKRALMAKPEYNELLEKLADEKDAWKSAKENLSDFLLGYFRETGEQQIELEPKDAREVILQARLGKAKGFQTSMFGKSVNNEEDQ